MMTGGTSRGLAQHDHTPSLPPLRTTPSPWVPPVVEQALVEDGA